ncbi:MAG: FG-GAP repeat protein [Planctomycetes bacterium]|nr:FG-GAP repeat protein [Planctomycetota bacterium]MCC7171815.1 FG-GAP repeat protein [Planctomycetota bacterium]
MKSKTFGPAGLIIALVLPALAIAQSREPFQRVDSGLPPFGAGGFGSNAVGLYDVEGDGFDDYAIAAPNFVHSGGMGRVFVISGRTGSVMVTLDGTTSGAAFGTGIAAVGDVDGDGVQEIAVSAPGADPPGKLNAGNVSCYSGATGVVLWSADGAAAFDEFGTTMCALNDTDADGVLELVVGAPKADPPTKPSAGRLHFLRGDSGVEFGSADGPLGGIELGTALAGRRETGLVYAGTWNGAVYSVQLPTSGSTTPMLFVAAPAGVADDASIALVNTGSNSVPNWLVAIGWYLADPGGVLNAGRVELRGASGGAALATFDGVSLGEGLGRRLSHVADADGDGAEEIAMASGVAGDPFDLRIRVATATGTVVDDVVREYGALVLTTIRDVSGDGRGEWITTIASGVASIFEATVFARGLVVSSSGVDAGGNLASTFSIDLGPVRAGNVYVQAWSLSGAAPGVAGVSVGAPLVPLNPDALTLAFLQVLNSAILPGHLGVLDAAGRASSALNLPAPAVGALSGLELTTCVIAADASSIVRGVSTPVTLDLP